MISYPPTIRTAVELELSSTPVVDKYGSITVQVPEQSGVVLSTWLAVDGAFADGWPLISAVDGTPALILPIDSSRGRNETHRLWFPLSSTASGETVVHLLSGAIRFSDRHNAQVLQVVASHLPDLSCVLFVSPHPDDTEISASGLVRRVQEAKGEVTLVCVTPGDGGPRIFPAYRRRIRFKLNLPRQLRGPYLPSDFIAKGRLRHQEQLRAATRMGVPRNRVHLLGYPDAMLESMRMESPATVMGQRTQVSDASPFPGTFRELRGLAPAPYQWSALVDDLTTIIGEVRPTTIVLPAPAEMKVDSHADHPAVHRAVIEAMELAKGMESVALVMYTNHADDHRWPQGSPNRQLTSGLPLEVLAREDFLPAWLEPLPVSFSPAAKGRLIRLFADAAKTGFDRRHARVDELFFVGEWRRSH